MSESEDFESERTHGWAKCPKHGRYRDDEKMCPDCYDVSKAMGGGDFEW